MYERYYTITKPNRSFLNTAVARITLGEMKEAGYDVGYATNNYRGYGPGHHKAEAKPKAVSDI